MSWLTPLGFLGLIGLIVWLIIYIIKPNYQKKILSTTYVWKRSLKYRRKRIPINKLRNILLILCQVLAITSMAMLLAQPFVKGAENEDNEKIIILDASADMLATLNGGGETRFDRAITQIREMIDEVTEEDGLVSIILADYDPEFIVQRAGADFKETTIEKLMLLAEPNDYKCTYGVANMDAAMELAERVLEENPRAEVVLFTGTDYTDHGKVTVVDVGDINEWNCAILNAEVVDVENYYEFRIDLAAYGRDASIEVFMDLYGVNSAKETLNLSATVLCTQEMGTVTLTFGNDIERADSEQNYILVDVYSYEYAYIYITQNDSLQCDNTLYLYGGTKPELKIQYFSPMPNLFYSGALMALRDALDDRWDINLTTVDPKEEPAFEGYDIYIFEHEMPDTIPTDGLVLLTNPDRAPSNAGFYLGSTVAHGDTEVFLTGGDEPSKLMDCVDAEAISLTAYTQITMFDGSYVPLLYCGNDAVMLARNDDAAQVVVMAFSLHRSNLPVLKEFPTLLLNMLKNYTPSTITEHLFEVNQAVELNARAPELNIEGPGIKTFITEFPANVTVTAPGVYTLSQIPISGNQVVESFFVKIPSRESNIRLVEDTLTDPYVEMVVEETDVDLVIFFAMIIVALLFAEWLLQLREYF